MLKWKIDVLTALREAGYNQTVIRRDKLMGQQMLTKLRNGDLPSWAVMNDICGWLHCQPGDLIEFVPDTEKAPDA